MNASFVHASYRFLHRHGAQVWLDPSGENSIRAAPRGSGFRWRVCVQGWPNLVHELAHVLQSGKLDEDSGFEYQLVPLDLGSAKGRRYLWDELCACALSCAWGRRCYDEAWVRSWFQEQVEILPVFFGDEAAPQRFVQRVSRSLMKHAQEVARAQYRLWALAHHLDRCDAPGQRPALRFPGLSTARDLLALRDPGFVAVKGPFEVATLWQAYLRDRMTGTSPA